MKLKSWGNFPSIISKIISMQSDDEAVSLLSSKEPFICYGNGRSYGDSAIGATQLDVRPHNLFIAFDTDNGIIEAQAGVLLADILAVCVTKNWNLAVVPGTKLITLGGAIASDIHGKNHHLLGCFSDHLLSFNLMLPNQSVVTCSSTENADLFHACCGGQGLLGIILDARIKLTKIPSSTLNVTTLKAKNLDETFAHFERHSDAPYSVAWIDCCAQGPQLGRSLISLGEFSDNDELVYVPKKRLNIPFYFPNFVLNKWTVKVFNSIYFHRIRTNQVKFKSEFDNFFFPLDRLKNWNRIYGKTGFIQYQFILPIEESKEGMRAILAHIANSGRASFLAVLKLHGPENKNLLSFPLRGHSLALDFKITHGLFEFLDELDLLVLKYNGRLYLAKDARVTKDVFASGYPRIDQFREVRNKIGASSTIQSRQSLRLEL